jgi:hypothetical protein
MVSDTPQPTHAASRHENRKIKSGVNKWNEPDRENIGY